MQKNGKRNTMSKSSKPLLIATGCSFTDGAQRRYIQRNIDVWPDVVSNFMDWDLINVGKAGSGNDYICNAAIDAILENNDRDIVVMALWSNATRLDFFDKDACVIVPNEYKSRVDEIARPALHKDEIIEFNKIIHELNYLPSIKWIIKHTIRNIWILNTLCKFNNIKIINSRYLNFLPLQGRYFDDEFLNNQIHELYFKDGIITKEDLNLSTILGRDEYCISKFDRHPNKRGHELIGHNFIEKYREKYG